MNSIGSRLEAVLDKLKYIKDNKLFADIGSDHAYLAIEAVSRGYAESAIASDINPMPLAKGKENANALGIDVEFILSDGFDAFDTLPVTSAAICGMGGELIAKIVLRSKICKSAHLLLQPMSAQEELRKALWDNGFEIECERFVVESKKPYTVISARYTGEKYKYSYLDLYLGKERSPSPEFSAYCEKALASAVKRKLGIISRGEDTRDIDSLIDFCNN